MLASCGKLDLGAGRHGRDGRKGSGRRESALWRPALGFSRSGVSIEVDVGMLFKLRSRRDPQLMVIIS